MDEPYTSEWWLWQMYRRVAAYVNEPSTGNEARLLGLIDDYRSHSRSAAGKLQSAPAPTPDRHCPQSSSNDRS